MSVAGLDFSKSLPPRFALSMGTTQSSGTGIGFSEHTEGVYQVLIIISPPCRVSAMAFVVRSNKVFLRIGRIS